MEFLVAFGFVAIVMAFGGWAIWRLAMEGPGEQSILNASTPSHDRVVSTGTLAPPPQQIPRAEVRIEDTPAYKEALARFAAQEEAFWAALIEEIDGDIFYSKLVGVTFRNEDGTSRRKLMQELKHHQELNLEPEPSNPKDANAMMVMNQYGEQLGYLSARVAEQVARGLRKGEFWRCFVSDLTGELEGPVRGVNVALLHWWPKVELNG